MIGSRRAQIRSNDRRSMIATVNRLSFTAAATVATATTPAAAGALRVVGLLRFLATVIAFAAFQRDLVDVDRDLLPVLKDKALVVAHRTAVGRASDRMVLEIE